VLRRSAGAPSIGRCDLSADGLTLYFETPTLDADVWLLEMK
jgi:hypothetical protein